MNFIKITFTFCLLFVFSYNAITQSSDNLIAIQIINDNEVVSPGGNSFLLLRFNIPKGIWLGADDNDARTPPGTKIKIIESRGIDFGDPQFPKSIEEWVPVKLGSTHVFKDETNVILPFKVDENLPEGTYDVKFKISYTPGYNAGRLSTHVNELYTANIKVQKGVKQVSIPSPSINELGNDYSVKPKSFENVPGLFKFMFNSLSEDKALTKGLHSLWLDSPDHGKSVRFMPFPFLNSTNITGSSIGMGASFFNSTKEGTMTGMFSMLGYANNLIGSAFGIQAISCPAAYHNYQLAAYFGNEEYRNVTLHYENFTLSNANWGLDFNFESSNEPRFRFFGLGPLAMEQNETAYEKTRLNAILDLYWLPVQNWRFGIGLSYDDFNVGNSFDELIETEGINFLQESEFSNNVIGLNGSRSTGLRANIIYDHRDQEFAPSKGFYGKLILSNNFLSDIGDFASNFYALNLDLRQYFSGPTQKLVFFMRGMLDLKSESDIPFYQLSSLGGQNSMRGYDFERYLGQHAAFVSGEMRYTLFTFPVLGYPMSMEMGAFLDVGQVFGNGFSFGDELNVDPGITMRMINKPNVGLILNYAIGNDGAYFTGGIGLPL